VIGKIRAHEAELRALGVTKLWLFGSVARDTPRLAGRLC
jgi:predicted nucleotidyltransferase